MIHMGETRYLSDRGPVTPPLIGADNIFSQDSGEEQSGSLNITMSLSLERNVKHEAMFVH
ncbi:hypothetical protein ACVWZX_003912 [Deinococcus sp. UYEF24]